MQTVLSIPGASMETVVGLFGESQGSQISSEWPRDCAIRSHARIQGDGKPLMAGWVSLSSWLWEGTSWHGKSSAAASLTHICSSSSADISVGCQCSQWSPTFHPEAPLGTGPSWTGPAGLVRDVSGRGETLSGVLGQSYSKHGPCLKPVHQLMVTHDDTGWKLRVSVEKLL